MRRSQCARPRERMAPSEGRTRSKVSSLRSHPSKEMWRTCASTPMWSRSCTHKHRSIRSGEKSHLNIFRYLNKGKWIKTKKTLEQSGCDSARRKEQRRRRTEGLSHVVGGHGGPQLPLAHNATPPLRHTPQRDRQNSKTI